MVTGLPAVVTALQLMVTHSSTLQSVARGGREHSTVCVHRYFHGDPLIGMVTGFPAVVTALQLMVTHSSTLQSVVEGGGSTPLLMCADIFVVTHFLAW